MVSCLLRPSYVLKHFYFSGLNSNGVAVDQDISLYVPWNGNISDRQMELKSVITIHKKNMRELCDLSSSLKVLPTFDTQCVYVVICENICINCF
jgi:hypothetical protein